MKIEEIKKFIEKYEQIIIFRHIQPDGDAYGSSFGLKRLININYPSKKVYCLGTRGNDLEAFFGKLDELKDDEINNALTITLDTPTLERIDGEQYKLGQEIVKIDHHILVDSFTENEWVDTKFSSTCEMITTMALKFKWKIDEIAATYLYFGLTTDAGRFLYSYTPNLFKCAQKLSKAKANVAKIYPFIYEQDMESSRFHGMCQANFKLTTHGVGYNKLTPEVLSKYGINIYQGAGMVNALSNIKGVDIWTHFSENEDHTIRCEIRSKGLPVNLVANEFGGGGHKQAAGCTLMNWDEADICLKKLDDLIFNSFDYHEQLKEGLKLIKEASKIALKYYRTQIDIQIKEDSSPVTNADLEIDEFLRKELSSLYPDYGFLTEESIDDKSRLDKEYVWLIDPIDGTKDFICKDDEYSINLALVRNHEVVLGIIAVPSLDKIYYAIKGFGAYCVDVFGGRRIHTNNKHEKLTALTSHYHLSDKDKKYLDQYNVIIPNVKCVGSAYKFCVIAEGGAEFNIKLGNQTKEWDIAPAVLIINEAGGSFTKPDGTPYIFNRKNPINEEGFIVMNKFNRGLIK